MPNPVPSFSVLPKFTVGPPLSIVHTYSGSAIDIVFEDILNFKEFSDHFYPTFCQMASNYYGRQWNSNVVRAIRFDVATRLYEMVLRGELYKSGDGLWFWDNPIEDPNDILKRIL